MPSLRLPTPRARLVLLALASLVAPPGARGAPCLEDGAETSQQVFNLNDKQSGRAKWKVGSGRTPSSRTGPRKAHGGSKYYYLEVSGASNGDYVSCRHHSPPPLTSPISPPFSLLHPPSRPFSPLHHPPTHSTQPPDQASLDSSGTDLGGGASSVSFWYHMYGSGIGSLEARPRPLHPALPPPPMHRPPRPNAHLPLTPRPPSPPPLPPRLGFAYPLLLTSTNPYLA